MFKVKIINSLDFFRFREHWCCP